MDVDSNIFNTSNNISTGISNLPQPDLLPYRLISDRYTKLEVDSKDSISSDAISTRITNLPQPDLTPYRLISNSYTKSVVDTKDSDTSMLYQQELQIYLLFQV